MHIRKSKKRLLILPSDTTLASYRQPDLEARPLPVQIETGEVMQIKYLQ